MPANQFSALAWLAPVAIIFWLGASIFFSLFDLFALVWWQQALGFMAVYAVWGGLVERYVRRYLTRQWMQSLAGPPTDAPKRLAAEAAEAPSEGLRPLPEPPGASPLALVPSDEPRPELSLVATAETWDDAYKKVFGRGAPVAQLMSYVAIGLAVFYPSWVVKLSVFVVLLAGSFGLGVWQRRRAMASGVETPRDALQTGRGQPSAKLGDAAERSPRAFPRE